MARLEKIVLQGFKSFKRKTSVPFPAGFSVITGPNGSGKSNIGDAVAFVLGKSSSKALRAKKSKDLVFHGSQKKGGSDYAKVALYFDNSEKTLPLEEKTVSISRRINKKGVSTYRMNGRVVTRQQIVDMFGLAGVSADGHNIIQQGDVTKIVEMDGEQRRKVIDEISGIAEFDEKKLKAEKELAKIEERVREAEIIINEKATIMEKLKQERDAAMKYRELETELSRVRAAVIWKDYSGSKKSMETIEKELVEKEQKLEELEEEIRGYDEGLSEKEEKLEELTKTVLKAGDQIEVTRKIENLRGEIERKSDKIEANGREMKRLDDIMEKISSMGSGSNPALDAVKSMSGVQGSLSELVMVPPEYRTAVEVSAGSHLRDIVVDHMGNAVKAVKYLKTNRIGRARFLPMDKVRGFPRKPLPQGAIGWLSELIQHDPLYDGIVNYVFSTTAAVKDIDRAKAIARNNRVRMVTLDGDLMEASGAITGGYFRKKSRQEPEISRYQEEKKTLAREIEALEKELKSINMDLEILAVKEKRTKTTDLERERVKLDEGLKKSREARKEAYEKRLIIQQEVGKLNINKARHEAKFENLKLQWEQRSERDEKAEEKNGGYPPELEEHIKIGVARLKDMEREAIIQIQNLGPINLKSVDDFDTLRTEFEDFKERVDKIIEEKDKIIQTVATIEEKRLTTFNKCLAEVSRHFKKVYTELVSGEAELVLENNADLESGLLIKAQPPGKKLLNIDSMSGGEKTLTAFTFLFAIQRYSPSPFYILDEADAALDKSNTKKVSTLIRKQCEMAQFIVISHNDSLVSEADQVYGVSMEQGESKVMGLELPTNADEQKNN
jgi:chromosome segregation protein